MHYNVPQFIDVEDKIAGPLTWKQFFWFLGLFGVGIIVYNVFVFNVFLAIMIPLTVAVAAFAFYKPYGVPLAAMSFYWLSFLFSPKLYVWRRMPLTKIQLSTEKEAPQKPVRMRQVSLEEVKNLAKMLDSPGEALTEKRKNGTMKQM